MFKDSEPPFVPEISLDAVFCDDIRQEVNGKVQILGVYQRDLIVPQFPSTVPLLVVQTTIKQRHDDTRPVQHIIFELPDGRIIEREFASVTTLPPMGGEIPDGSMVSVTHHVERFTDLQITAPGRLKVRAKIGDVRYAVSSLRITDNLHLADELSEVALNQHSIHLALSYLASLFERIGHQNLSNAKDAMIRLLMELCRNKMELQLSDINQPVWIIERRHRIWVLKTQPWHTASLMSITRDGIPMIYQVVEENAVAVVIELKESAILIADKLQILFEYPL